MSSGFSQALIALTLAVAGGVAGAADPAAARELRVCEDPNNLPFSNNRGEGFENELATLVAKDLGRTVRYTWWPQRRGFIRNTLRAGACDVVMGIPSSYGLAQPTVPYYRSTYVFVTRRDRRLHIASFDDPRLRTLRIGLHAIGDDYNNVPPAQALASRGIVDNIRGYSIYGAYSQPNPPKALIDAVAKGDIDIAVAWGPLAGYFAKLSAVPLEVTPVARTVERPPLPMTFEISMGVREGDMQLKSALDRVLTHRREDIRRLLARYGVPFLRESSSIHVAGSAE
jgi:quinoprotein dehydrogenase-associated probable ABC transporter substrate-binding protein